ncbi:MAG: tRNA-dependent cyclodipeptide synthase [Nanoarchaeota archaeon]
MNEELGLIWMSAGNSYFDEKTIGRLLKFAEKKFKKIIILSPDEPAEHTFRALGYSNSKARRKASLNSNLLINRAKRELQKIENKDKFYFVYWKRDIVRNPEYEKKYKETMLLYKNNASFRKDARENTKKVISDKFNDVIEVDRAVDEAVCYLLEELAFILSCNSIYGVNNVSYLYHQNWEIYENLINGKYDGKKRENFNFVLTGIK